MLVRFSFALIALYRKIAPDWMRQSCRFEPSCSEYALQALKKYGFMQGWKKSLQRIYRCKPPHGGVDHP